MILPNTHPTTATSDTSPIRLIIIIIPRFCHIRQYSIFSLSKWPNDLPIMDSVCYFSLVHVTILLYNETTAVALYGYHSSLSYLTPVLGAYGADVIRGTPQWDGSIFVSWLLESRTVEIRREVNRTSIFNVERLHS